MSSTAHSAYNQLIRKLDDALNKVATNQNTYFFAKDNNIAIFRFNGNWCHPKKGSNSGEVIK